MRRETTFGHKAATPSRSAETFRNMAIGFLNTELELGKTFAQIATTRRDPKGKARCVSSAREAYETVLRFLPHAPLTESEIGQIKEGVHSLRSRLQGLGENLNGSHQFGRSVPPVTTHRTEHQRHKQRSFADQRDVQQFLDECHQLRDQTKHMLAQNKTIMDK